MGSDESESVGTTGLQVAADDERRGERRGEPSGGMNGTWDKSP